VCASDAGPCRDFAFGTCPRLGRGATSSNRGDGQRSIQLFSAHGAYNGEGASLTYDHTGAGTPDGYVQDAGDVPVEPPRHFSHHFDPGPSASWARLLMGGETGLAWPDFAGLGVTSDASFG